MQTHNILSQIEESLAEIYESPEFSTNWKEAIRSLDEAVDLLREKAGA